MSVVYAVHQRKVTTFSLFFLYFFILWTVVLYDILVILGGFFAFAHYYVSQFAFMSHLHIDYICTFNNVLSFLAQVPQETMLSF